MNVQTKPTAAIRHEGMRIAGQRVDLDERIEVFNPYNNAVVGTVPAARAEHVRSAFAKAAAFKPKLTRYERQQILLRTAELSARPQGRIRPPDHRGIRTVLEGFALRSRPRLRRLFFRRPAHHPGRRRNLFLRYLAPGQAAQDLHHAHAAQRRDLRHHAVQSSAQHGVAQAGAGHRHQQSRGAEADRADAADRACARGRALRSRFAAGNVVGRHRQSLHHGGCHDHRSGLRPHHLHRLGAGRQIHRQQGRLSPHRAGTRRQRSADRDGGRRSRQGGGTRGLPAPPRIPASAARR